MTKEVYRLLTENPCLEAIFQHPLEVGEHCLARLGDLLRDTKLTERLPLGRTAHPPVDEAIPEMLHLHLDAGIEWEASFYETAPENS